MNGHHFANKSPSDKFDLRQKTEEIVAKFLSSPLLSADFGLTVPSDLTVAEVDVVWILPSYSLSLSLSLVHRSSRRTDEGRIRRGGGKGR